MKLDPANLASQLSSSLALLYLLNGDEALLVNESADAIRQAARQQGLTDREVFYADGSHFDWNVVIDSLNSMSLFSSRKLVEIHSDRKHLADERFLSYWERPNPDCVVMVITDKLDKKASTTSWYKQFDSTGMVIDFWPLEGVKLSKWLSQRAQRMGLVMNSDAITLLQERTEGNLLAASQELEKLQLQFGCEPVTADKLDHAVADHARYDAFKLVDAALAGDTAMTLRILQGLKEEGTAIPAILWVVLRELRTLAALLEATSQGQRADTLYPRFGIWQRRQTLIEKALRRLNHKQVLKLLQEANRVDLAIKGMDSHRDAALLMENLCLGLCGVRGLCTA